MKRFTAVFGITLVNSTGYRVLKNDSSLNGGAGIVLRGSDNNFVRGNMTNNNGVDGITLVVDSDHNTVQENEILDNRAAGAHGLSVSFNSDGNTINRNDAFGNTTDIVDNSRGSETKGTANTYLGNNCNTSSPPNLC